eukprot:6191962-Pleurochrysis_carterae.AAC.5
MNANEQIRRQRVRKRLCLPFRLLGILLAAPNPPVLTGRATCARRRQGLACGCVHGLACTRARGRSRRRAHGRARVSRLCAARRRVDAVDEVAARERRRLVDAHELHLSAAATHKHVRAKGSVHARHDLVLIPKDNGRDFRRATPSNRVHA